MEKKKNGRQKKTIPAKTDNEKQTDARLRELRQTNQALRAEIAELNKTKEHLKESENRYRAVFDSMITGIVIVEEDTTISFVNAEFEKLVGCSRKEIEGRKSWMEFAAKEDISRMLLQHHLRRVDNNAAEKHYEFRLIDSEGDIKNTFLSIDMIPGTKKSVASFLDITERRRAEEALAVSEKKYRTIYENTTLGIFETTRAGKVVHANHTFARMFGYESPGQLVDEIHDLAVQIYKDPRTRADIITSVLGSTTPLQLETDFRRRDGSTFSGILEIQSFHSEKNDDIHFIGFVEDISQRKKAEEGQRIAEELYRTLAEKSFAGVYVVQNGRFMFINSNAAQYAGYTREELIGRSTAKIIHPEDLKIARDHAVEMLSGKRDSPYEFRIVTRRGEIRWIMETLTSINYLGKPAILGNSMDITDYKSVAAERENIILQLQKALLEVKKLSGLLPICSCCKKIRNDEGYWEQLEVYIRDRTEAEFSHGICPECAKKIYAEFYKETSNDE